MMFSKSEDDGGEKPIEESLIEEDTNVNSSSKKG
jgi:hypothetical protein